MNAHYPGSVVYGFLGGPKGVMTNPFKFPEATEIVRPPTPDAFGTSSTRAGLSSASALGDMTMPTAPIAWLWELLDALVGHAWKHTRMCSMYVCMYAYSMQEYKYIHSCIHTFVHTYIRTYVRTYMHT